MTQQHSEKNMKNSGVSVVLLGSSSAEGDPPEKSQLAASLNSSIDSGHLLIVNLANLPKVAICALWLAKGYYYKRPNQPKSISKPQHPERAESI